MAPGPNALPNRAMKKLLKKFVKFLSNMINEFLKWEDYPVEWKYVRVIALLNPRKDPALPLSYKPISLLDTIRQLIENILLFILIAQIITLGLLRYYARQYSWPNC